MCGVLPPSFVPSRLKVEDPNAAFMASAPQKNNLSKVLILLGIFVASTIVVIKNPKKALVSN
jgi:hypothetical protein